MVEKIHSGPTWLFGDGRSANAKFGAGNPKLGDHLVQDRLFRIKDISTTLLANGVISSELATSGHTGLEFRSSIPDCPANRSASITFNDLMIQIRLNQIPKINAITAPAFGYPGAETGAMLSPNAQDREMAKAMHLEALQMSKTLKDEGLGYGRCIWWPAFGGWRWQNQLSDDEAYTMLLDFWVDVLGSSEDGVMHLEFKPGDPCIDYLCTPRRAISFCHQINGLLGRKAMLLNNEVAHWYLSGYTALEMVKMTIQEELFDGFFHANSGQMLPVNLDLFIEEYEVRYGTIHPADIPIMIDWDWRWGQGSPTIVQDQQNAVSYLKNKWNGDLMIEHDIDAQGSDPYDNFVESITSFENMWNNA